MIVPSKQQRCIVVGIDSAPILENNFTRYSITQMSQNYLGVSEEEELVKGHVQSRENVVVAFVHRQPFLVSSVRQPDAAIVSNILVQSQSAIDLKIDALNFPKKKGTCIQFIRWPQ
jgi:hypothetical protein